MATTNATIDLASDITDSSLAVSNTTELNTAGTTTGVNTMTSVTRTDLIDITNQFDTTLGPQHSPFFTWAHGRISSIHQRLQHCT